MSCWLESMSHWHKPLACSLIEASAPASGATPRPQLFSSLSKPARILTHTHQLLHQPALAPWPVRCAPLITSPPMHACTYIHSHTPAPPPTSMGPSACASRTSRHQPAHACLPGLGRSRASHTSF